MSAPTSTHDQSSDREQPGAEADLWESRLLALNALVELARHQAVARPAPGDATYRLEHALSKVRQAVGGGEPDSRDTVDAAVTAFGEALASLSTSNEQRQ